MVKRRRLYGEPADLLALRSKRSSTLKAVDEEASSYPWPLFNTAPVGLESSRPPFRLVPCKRLRKVNGDDGSGYNNNNNNEEGGARDAYYYRDADEDDDDEEEDQYEEDSEEDGYDADGAWERRERRRALRREYPRLPTGVQQDGGGDSGGGEGFSEHTLAMAAAETRRLEAKLEAQVRTNNQR